MSRCRSWRCWPKSPSAWPVPPAAPWVALDQLLEASYGAAIERLDRVAIFDLSNKALRNRLGPFTNPKETTRCKT